MNLYLVRHAIAAERGTEWRDDDQRPLTREGSARFRRVAEALKALGVHLDRIVTSPCVRTRQTADILAEVVAPAAALATSTALRPESATVATMRMLARLPIGTCVAVVGHEPALGQLAAALLGMQRPLEFRKGSVCALEIDRRRPLRGRLRWHAPPAMLKRIRATEAVYKDVT